MLSIRFVSCASLLVLALGCSKSKPEGGEGASAAAKASEVVAGARPKREKKDRGDASMKLGGVAWAGESASARVNGKNLVIRASRMDMGGGKATREELHLAVGDYAGPGTYTTKMGSRFISVTLNTGKVGKGEDEATEEATKAIKGADHVMIMGATVVVESSTEDELVGTFSWESKTGQPSIAEGKFRARVK